MKSLILAGFPRSMTSPLYTILREATSPPLRAYPTQDTADRPGAEAINWRVSKKDWWPFDRGERNYPTYLKGLDEHRGGWLIKEVNCPHYLQRYQQATDKEHFNILWLHRNPVDIVFCWLKRGWGGMMNVNPVFSSPDLGVQAWIYCAQAPDRGGPPEVVRVLFTFLLLGVARVQAEITDLPDQVVDFDSVIHDPSSLWAALESLGVEHKKYDYLTEDFLDRREDVLGYRDTPLLHEVDSCWKAIHGGK